MAANTMPIPAPPRTPSPMSDDGRDPDVGLGIDVVSPKTQEPPAAFQFDLSSPTTQSPARAFPNATMLSPEFTPTISPAKTLESVDSPMAPFSMPAAQAFDREEDMNTQNPFNFTTQQYTAGRINAAKTDLGRRKGHKYKHSSISHQIFQAPAPRPSIHTPTSLPMPTRDEVQHSLTSEQKMRLFWCLGHFAVAGYVQWSAHGSLAMTALSRLLFFDASGAVICVFVDMMENFEVWKRSSLRHPFG